MDEEQNLPQEETKLTEEVHTQDDRKAGAPRGIGGYAFRILAIGYVLYQLYEVIRMYAEGGPEAPALWLLILSIVVLGGGAGVIAFLTWRDWKSNQDN